MGRRPSIFVFALLFTFFAGIARGQQVNTSLLCSVRDIQPGKPFWLGVKLTIDQGWHIYWKYPGDSGLPTRVKWTLPAGFSAGELQYPTPIRIEQPGNIVMFGYEGSVILLTQITPPENLPPSFRDDFIANVSWLVCSPVTCVPGRGSANISLACGSGQPSDDADALNEAIAELPVPWDKSPAVAHVNQQPHNHSITVTWNHNAPPSTDFFPQTPDDFNITGSQTASALNETIIRFRIEPLAGKHPASMTMDSVLGFFDKDGHRRGIMVPVALPASGG